QMFDFSWKLDNAYTFWAGIVGGIFLTLGTHGTDQMLVQRYMSARSQRGAGLALVLSGFVVFLQFGLFLLLGVALGCFYTQNPPAEAFAFNDQVFATFIVNELPANVGIIGLLLAAVFSAAMSTLSSSLNSSAAAIVNDFGVVRSSQEDPASASKAITATRGFTVLFGIIQMVVAVIAQYYSRSVVSDALAVAGFSAGLLLGLFALGVLTKHVRQPAALIGLLVGLTVLIVVKFGGRLGLAQLGINIPAIAWPWLPVIGSVVTFAVAMLASLGDAGRSTS
ncbi:MAG: transporter, partial [Planctomycetota bacterium]